MPPKMHEPNDNIENIWNISVAWSAVKSNLFVRYKVNMADGIFKRLYLVNKCSR